MKTENNGLLDELNSIRRENEKLRAEVDRFKLNCDEFGTHKHVARWLEAETYRNIIHRHDGTFVAADESARRLVRADTIPLLSDALLNWPNDTEELKPSHYIKTDTVEELRGERDSLRERCDQLRAELDALPGKWTEDSSLETWFPITAQELSKLRAELDRRVSYQEAVLKPGEIKIKFEPRDCWVGLFWTGAGRVTTLTTDREYYTVYLCLVPCFPVIFRVWRSIPRDKRSIDW